MVWDQERAGRIQEALAESGFAALVCRLPENVLLLTGYWPMNGMSWVVAAQGHEPFVIVPKGEEEWVHLAVATENAVYYGWGGVHDPAPDTQIARLLSEIVARFGLGKGRIGYEGNFETVAPPFLSAENHVSSSPSLAMLRSIFGDRLADASDSINLWRSIKTAKEVEALRLANRVAALGLQVFVDSAVVGAKEAEVSAAVEAAIYGQGVGFNSVRRCRGWASVMSGPDEGARAWYQYLVSRDRRIEQGDTVLLELGTVVEGYWSDLTRTVVVGQASERTADAYGAVLEAQQAAINKLHPGIPASDIYSTAFEVLQSRGWSDLFPHGAGHGTGFRYHEPLPLFLPDYSGVLEEGMVVTVEPGVYKQGFGGIRIEDDVLVTAEGPVILSEFPKELLITG